MVLLYQLTHHIVLSKATTALYRMWITRTTRLNSTHVHQYLSGSLFAFLVFHNCLLNSCDQTSQDHGASLVMNSTSHDETGVSYAVLQTSTHVTCCEAGHLKCMSLSDNLQKFNVRSCCNEHLFSRTVVSQWPLVVKRGRQNLIPEIPQRFQDAFFRMVCEYLTLRGFLSFTWENCCHRLPLLCSVGLTSGPFKPSLM